MIPSDILDDILCRFILNTPESERSLQRIGFRLEKAHWFYMDFHCKDSEKIEFSDFIDEIKKATPFLRNLPLPGNKIQRNHSNYMSKIPRYGCIILNQNRTKLLLVQNAKWKAKNSNTQHQHAHSNQNYNYNQKEMMYSFPKGKINYDELPLECAIRETIEEIGFNVANYVSAEDCIIHERKQGNSNCYFIADRVSDSTIFKSIARFEIDDIKWFDIEKIRRNRDAMMFSQVADLIDPIQLLIIEKDKREMSLQLQQHRVSFFDSLQSIANQFEEFCLSDCKIFTEEQIIAIGQGKTGEEENPFLNFTFHKTSHVAAAVATVSV